MTMFAGLDVGGKRTAVCVLDEAGKVVWRGMVDTHPEMIDAVLRRFKGELTKVGLESGPFTPHLFRSLAAIGYPMICMDARRAADAIKSRRIKSDKGDAWALAEMLRTGWFTSVHVKSVDTHRLKALLGARDQLVKVKRSLGNQVRGLLRPFGIRLPSRAGMKKFVEAAYQATRDDPVMGASIEALLEALASIEAQLAKLDDDLKELSRRNEVAWRLMSVPGVGPITALAYIAAIENVERFQKNARHWGVSRADRETLPIGRHRCRHGHLQTGRRHGAALSLRGRQCAADDGQEALRLAQLGAEADQDDRSEARPRGGGEKAGGLAGTHVEGRRALRGGCRGIADERLVDEKGSQSLSVPPLGNEAGADPKGERATRWLQVKTCA